MPTLDTIKHLFQGLSWLAVAGYNAMLFFGIDVAGAYQRGVYDDYRVLLLLPLMLGIVATYVVFRFPSSLFWWIAAFFALFVSWALTYYLIVLPSHGGSELTVPSWVTYTLALSLLPGPLLQMVLFVVGRLLPPPPPGAAAEP
jgi:hypothetical protein